MAIQGGPRIGRKHRAVSALAAAAPNFLDARLLSATTGAHAPLATTWLESESDLYLANRWCLNPFPTVAELVRRLEVELDRVVTAGEPWQRAEAITNVLLMACAITDAINDYLLVLRNDLTRARALVPIPRPLAQTIESLLAVHWKARLWRRRSLYRWQQEWDIALEEFARAALVTPRRQLVRTGSICERLRSLLQAPLPDEILAWRPRIPGAFRRHDLTHHDVIALARKFAVSHPDRRAPLLIVAVRTAGAYFAPVVAACLKAAGYEHVDCATLHPKKGMLPQDARRVERCTRRGGKLVILDEPLDTGATLAAVVGALRNVGAAAGSIVALLPVHPQRRDWSAEFAHLALDDVRVVRLEPEEWYKHNLLAASTVELNLRPYFLRRGYAQVKVIESADAAAFNESLARSSGAYFGSRLKRVYEVRLARADDQRESRFILAKSVGWGWFGYHAFLAAAALAPFIAPVLGLRDGILYMEWLPQSSGGAAGVDRKQIVRVVAAYVAARARLLKLGDDPCPELSRRRHHDGIELLANVLGKACGSRLAAALHVPRIRDELARSSGAVASLVDARMDPAEWITTRGVLLKTDFEHHGLGKSVLNMTDPACDLAGAIFGFGMSLDEERALLAQYVWDSGDPEIKERLLLNKILVGSAAMTGGLSQLADPSLVHQHAQASRSYIAAWHFLTAQTARFCGSLLPGAEIIRWRSPLMVLDLDGVVDTRRFGFPCTSEAGLRALALLHTHGIAIALNTARAIGEVKEYCAAYGCAGAVAEYGSIAWDAVSGRERVLATAAALLQLEHLRGALRAIPGIYLDDTYQYSIRAFRFEGGSMVPVSDATISGIVSRLKADEVVVRHTTIDTAIYARGVDKGTGLRALLELSALPDADTIAVGDSEPDLAMFRVARRAYAPANISCRREAVEIGCRIAEAACQQGLLDVVRQVLHPGGRRCAQCESAETAPPTDKTLFLKLLGFADRARGSLLFHALADPKAIRAFLASE